MSKFKEHYRVLQYRPQAAKSLRSTLHTHLSVIFRPTS
jgi:hypothetical protein